MVAANGREAVVLQAVGMAAERFLAAAEWRTAVPEVLAALGEATDASRVHIYSVTPGEDGEVYSSLQYEWIGGDVTPQIDNPIEQDFPLRSGGYGRWIEVLGSGALLQGLRAEFPEVEREFLESEDILSVLVVPVFAEGRWWGWIGFDDTRVERAWTQAETDALRTAAGILGAAIQRERMEEDRVSAEAKYRTLVEQLPSITYISTASEDNATLYISPQVHDLLGYAPADWIKTRGIWEKSIHPDDQERVIAASEASGVSGEPFNEIYRIRSRYGRELWVHDQAVLVRGANSEPLYWQGVILDVTAQKEAERKAAASETRYRNLVEHIPAVTYVDLPLEEHVQYMSPQIEGMVGVTAEEWLASPGMWHELVHPDDLDRVVAENERAEREGTRFYQEYRMLHRDGRVIWVLDEANPVLGEDGRPEYWQGLMIDVTAEREAERTIHDAEQRFRTMVEQVPAVIYIDRLEGRSNGIYISPQIQEMTGYTAEEWLADQDLWERLIHPDDLERVLAADDVSDSTGAPFDVEYRMVAKDGHTVIVHEMTWLQTDKEGKPMHWQGVILDVTASRRSEELEWALEVEKGATQRLRDLDAIKNTYLTTIAHDLRTPLSVILGLALTMQRPELGLDASEIVDLSGRIALHARKLDRMVKDLLDLEKLTSGTMGLERMPTEVAPLVARIVHDADYLEGHEITVAVPSLTVDVDPAKFERILENLLVNAANHTPAGTPIWIGASKRDGGLYLRVDDAGPGVPADQREDIFRAFTQGTQSKGSGVGLSLVARLAELHGGKAWVTEREGGGASFRVLLPSGRDETD